MEIIGAILAKQLTLGKDLGPHIWCYSISKYVQDIAKRYTITFKILQPLLLFEHYFLTETSLRIDMQ